MMDLPLVKYANIIPYSSFECHCQFIQRNCFDLGCTIDGNLFGTFQVVILLLKDHGLGSQVLGCLMCHHHVIPQYVLKLIPPNILAKEGCTG